MTTIRTITIFLLLGFGATATAEASKKHPQAQGSGKKLYCWSENGHKVSGDALPAEAAERARTEINAKRASYRRRGPALTPDEARPRTSQRHVQAQVAADSEAARQRRDLAMVESYGTEADLRRAYGERIGLLDATIKAKNWVSPTCA